MAAAASDAAGSGGSVEVVVDGELFSEHEVVVATILADLPSIVRARSGQRRLRGSQQQKQQRERPEIPSWGRRQPRTVPAAGKPVPAAPDRGEGAASPDTPLAFPEDDGEEEDEAAAATKKKARAQDEWVQEQRGVVASLSHENAHLLKQIKEFKARLQHSRSTNDSLKQMQSKHKKRQRRQEEEQERERKRKLQARAAAAGDRPALGLDLNEPAEAEAEAEDAKPQPQAVPAQWCHRGQQMVQHKAALTAAARRRRQEIRRAKVAASRTRRLG